MPFLKNHKAHILSTWTGISWNIMYMMITEIAKFNGTEACYSEQAKKVSPSPAQTQKKANISTFG